MTSQDRVGHSSECHEMAMNEGCGFGGVCSCDVAGGSGVDS